MSDKRHDKHEEHHHPNHHTEPADQREIKWPPIYPVRIEPSPGDAQKYGSEQLYRKKQLRFAQCLNWITVGAAAVGLFGLIYLYGQLGAMRESNKINREALESVQRAFVTFSPSSTVALNTIDGKISSWSFQIPIANSGATPARNLLDKLNVYISSQEMPEDFSFPDTGRKPDHAVLGPKDGLTIQSDPVDVETISNVTWRHAGHLYLYGWATYNDVFPKTKVHVTKFCYELTGVTDDPLTGKLTGSGRLTVYGDHNCADEDCERKN